MTRKSIQEINYPSGQDCHGKANGTANGATTSSFSGWMGICFGFRGAENVGTETSAYSRSSSKHNGDKPIHEYYHNLSRVLWTWSMHGILSINLQTSFL